MVVWVQCLVPMPQQKVVALAVEWVAVVVMVEMVAFLTGETDVPVVAFAVAVDVVVVWLAGLAEAVVVLAVLCWPRGWHRPQSRNWDRILRCQERSYDSQGRCGQRS